MKKVINITLVTLLVGCSASTEAPENVVNAFTQKFPNVNDVDWDKENDTEWEAEFEMEGKEYSANFGVDGSWKENEHEIELSDVPNLIKNKLDTDYSNYKKEEIEYSEKKEGNFYEFELESDEKTIEVAFNEKGEVVKEEVVESDED